MAINPNLPLDPFKHEKERLVDHSPFNEPMIMFVNHQVDEWRDFARQHNANLPDIPEHKSQAVQLSFDI